MEPKTAVFAVIGVVVLLLMLWWKRAQRRPAERTFRCRRCGSIAPHGARTLNAWRQGRTDFFCGRCHGQWLDRHGKRESPVARRGTRDTQGCLGVVVVACMPALAALAWLATPS